MLFAVIYYYYQQIQQFLGSAVVCWGIFFRAPTNCWWELQKLTLQLSSFEIRKDLKGINDPMGTFTMTDNDLTL